MKRLLVATAAALLLAAAPAHAATFEVGMEDEGLILSNQSLAPAAVAAWRTMGVDVVRIHARWWEIAPADGSTKKPSGFNAANHKDPKYRFANLDAAVQIVRGGGLKVMLTITGPGPLWASSQPSKHNPRWKPSPKAYADFSKAVATRYKDQVDRYLLWNEPNQKGWLQPQWDRIGRRSFVPASPHIYRSLVRAAEPAVHAADRGSEVVIGELAPIGNRPISTDTPMRPLSFLRSLGCVDDRYKSIRTGRCKGFRSARGDSLGYHPHPTMRAPDKVNPDVDSAQFADMSRLFSTLDKLKKRKRIRVSGNIHLTEFGYETSPPDKASGIKLALQTRYVQQASYLAWKYKRVRGLSFYQWDDERTTNLGSGTKRYSGWQTGLRYNNGKPKPVLAVMPNPFVIEQAPKATSKSVFWGQVRPDAEPAVTLLIRKRGSKEFTTLAKLNTKADGVWTTKIKLTARAAYRYQWTPKPTIFVPDPQPKLSGIIDLARKETSRLKASLAPSG